LTKPFKMLSRALASAPEGLEGRDPEFIRDTLPHLWLAVQLYFRAEVHGFENVPDEPVLFVGNHSGGANTPDTFMFTLAYHTFMTVEGRPLVALAHEVIVRIPVIGDIARKYGMVQAGQSAAGELLAEGANVLVYPGGDVEALRPWRDRNKIMFDGRKGFLKLAHERRVKIVPVVSVGGQETFFVHERLRQIRSHHAKPRRLAGMGPPYRRRNDPCRQRDTCRAAVRAHPGLALAAGHPPPCAH
jgi:1-acyl-sn-glycerol-3-phosphate acyltransferase